MCLMAALPIISDRKKLEEETGFMTANDVTVTKFGVRAQIAAWDRVSDYVLMKSPDLISWGERVMQARFSSVWMPVHHHFCPGGCVAILVSLS